MAHGLQLIAALLLLLVLLVCCGVQGRRAKVCAQFCGSRTFTVDRDGWFGADARVRWWCTCADGTQKEIF